ncbi:DUF2809 domain-containing protein [Pedobacter alpinus]|uniref:DUF2809 domain-containing protein n=1 Tax=Pedobacter alpinus TaxID=1590643 RepID=A0ABW5TQX9_9SPHI
MFKFNLNYFLGFLFLLITEILIAIYVHDNFVRPFLGDFLVVILLYCMVKSFIKNKILLIALSVLLFSYLIEIAQYFELVKILGLENHQLATIIIGTYFSVIDLLMYTLGIAFVLIVETFINRRSKNKIWNTL